MKTLLMALLFSLGALTSQAHTHSVHSQGTKTILVGSDIAGLLNLDVIADHSGLEISLAEVTGSEADLIHSLAHEFGRCGGFEYVDSNELAFASLQEMSELRAKNIEYANLSNILANKVQKDTVIEKALNEVNPDNLKETVEWLVGFKSRAARAKKPNKHVEALKELLEEMAKNTSLDVEIELVDHKNTKQKSVSAKIVGNSRADEVIVLGGHLDSINQGIFGIGGNGLEAPGADDNASGSANLVEAFRILLEQEQPERTIQFYWYAAEELGLVGSAEIAKAYKKEKIDVVAVLQLDMTLFPGSGEFTMGSMTDFTSAWLRKYLEEINSVYLNGKIQKSKCGYGCSDHASWHRQGFPALMPFEASFNKMNQRIHTKSDIVDKRANFKHSAMFTKIALVMAMDLGNSMNRQPF